MEQHSFLLKLGWKFKSFWSLSILASLLQAITIVLQATLLSNIITRVFQDHQHLSSLIPPLFLLIIILLSRALLQYIANLNGAKLGSAVKSSLRREVLTHITKKQIWANHINDTGKPTTIIIDGIDNLEAYYNQFIPQVALSIFIPGIILSFVFPIDHLTFFIFLLTAPLIPLFMFLIGSQVNQATKKQWEKLNLLSSQMLDTIQGLATLKILGQSSTHEKRLERTDHEYQKGTLNVLRLTFTSALALELVATISLAIVAVAVGLRLLYGSMAFQPALTILILAPEFYMPLRNLSARFHAASLGIQASQNILSLLSEPQSNISVDQHHQHHQSIKQPFPLTVHNLSYCPSQSNRPIIHNLQFTIEPGKLIAIVGPSGAGKSTIFHLLLRFIAPSHGFITIAGIDMNSISIPEWRKLFAWVPQRPAFIYGTISDNLSIAQPAATKKQMEQVLEIVGLDDLLGHLPHGLNSHLGPEGYQVSSGQAQRLSIARALLSKRPYILLDEPTSQNDPIAELQLQRACNSLLELTDQDVSILMIAHRMNTVKQADHILVMNNGELVQTGTHHQLIQENGIYKRLWTPLY